MSPFIWVFLFFVAALYLLQKRKDSNKKTPPGPLSLPVLGSLLSIGWFPHKTYAKWAKKYGSIFKVHLGQERIVVLSDLGILKEAFQSPVFSGRPQIELFQLFSDYKGIISTEGPEWEEQRRFTLRHLRDFGFGKNSMESMIHNEIDTFLDWLETGKPITLDRKFTIAVINALWTILTSEKLPYDDPKLTELVKKSQLDVSGAQFAINFFMPWLSKLAPSLLRWEQVKDMFASNRAFISIPIKEHQKTYDENSEPRDFIDTYLGHMKKADKNSSFYGNDGERNLISTITDLFLAGTNTTSFAMTWIMLHSIMNLDHQKKLQEEIDSVVGKSRKPSMTDKPNMPFVEAFILEVLRHSSFLPGGVLHSAMADTEFHGYFFSKGTIVLPNIHYIHHDEKLWGDPQNFRPSRFLSKDGKSILSKEASQVIQFSVGKRQCLGETLARTQLFLFTTSIFQRFDVRPKPGAKLTTDPQYNLDTLEPPKFEVVLTEREFVK